MTTITKKAKPRRKSRPSLPAAADVATIAGRDFVIMPLDEFEEWREDQLLSAVVAQRLESGEKIVPFKEIEARLDRRAKARK